MKIRYFVLYFSFLVFVFGCGDQNVFEWSHQDGSNKSVAGLTADADSAYADGDYKKAQKYYQEVVNKDSDNSVALYGIAKSAYGKHGISMAKLAASFLDETENLSPPSLSQSAFNVVGGVGDIKTGFLPLSSDDLIPDDLDLKALLAATNEIIPALRKIADGKGDGVIPADDADVNINLAIALVLNATLLVLDSNDDGTPGGAGDIITVKQDFTLVIPDTITSEQKETLIPRVVKALVKIVGGARAYTITVGADGIDQAENGAVQYIASAINSNDLPETGILSELEDLFNTLVDNASDTDLTQLYEDLIEVV